MAMTGLELTAMFLERCVFQAKSSNIPFSLKCSTLLSSHNSFTKVSVPHVQCPVRLGSTKKKMLLTEEIGIEKSIERISGIRTIQNGGRGIN